MFAISMLFIVALVGVLVVEWAARPSTPPTFRTRVETVHLVDGTFHVPVTVENIGSQAAAGVQVGAELDLGIGTLNAEEVLDFLAPGESTTVTFVFARDPRQGNLSVSVRAFEEP